MCVFSILVSIIWLVLVAFFAAAAAVLVDNIASHLLFYTTSQHRVVDFMCAVVFLFWSIACYWPHSPDGISNMQSKYIYMCLCRLWSSTAKIHTNNLFYQIVCTGKRERELIASGPWTRCSTRIIRQVQMHRSIEQIQKLRMFKWFCGVGFDAPHTSLNFIDLFGLKKSSCLRN